jgi:hypothetical protein
VSNLGNTSEDYKSTLLQGKTETVTSFGTSSTSKTIKCAYPCYHNKSDLGNAPSTKILQESSSFTIETIPSEEAVGKSFVFEYPAHKTVNSVKSLLKPFEYTYYTNISGGALVESVSTSAGKLSTTLTLSNVPSEAVSQRHFVFEYTAQAKIKKVQKLNTVSNKYEDIDSYNIVTGINRGGNSYNRFEITGSFSGISTYQITFESPSYTTVTDYTISDPINRTINGTVYSYRQLITNGTAGIVSRQITLNGSLTS